MLYHEEKNIFEEKVAKYKHLQVNGIDFPPLLVRYSNQKYDLYDGAHRYEVYHRCNYSYVKVIIWCPSQNDVDMFYDENMDDLFYQYCQCIQITK